MGHAGAIIPELQGRPCRQRSMMAPAWPMQHAARLTLGSIEYQRWVV